MKINVKPEGRENIFLPEKKSLIAFIKHKGFKTIHNFIPNGSMIIGADHDVKSVFEDINRAERLALFADPSANMGHSLALIYKERLECYDIGKLTLDDLNITK